MVTIAVAKGYLLKKTIERLTQLGYSFSDDITTSRKLFIEDTSGKIKLLLIRPWDVPVYVSHGAADLGVVGQDILREQSPTVFTLCDLAFGQCSLVIAGPQPIAPHDLTHHLRVATKFTNSTQSYFQAKGLNVKMIKLYGAIELAPITGLSDIICDLTATGATLKENNLHIIDTVYTSTAHLIANPVGLKVHDLFIRDLVASLN
jgi:ATP phosphoribosyltransferase